MSKQHYANIADLYDSFVTMQTDVPFFVNEAQKANGPVLELMSGTGRLSIPLLQAGIPLTCVDYSPYMLARLRERLDQNNLTAAVYEMDVRTFELGQQYQQIIIPFGAFSELPSHADQQQALERIHAHLADGGTFICALGNPPVRIKSVDHELHLAGRFPTEQGQLFVWLLQQHDPNTKLVNVMEFFELYDAQGVMTSKRFSEIQFHLLEKAVFERLIGEAGFEVVDLYGDYSYAPFEGQTSPFMLWVLRKAP